MFNLYKNELSPFLRSKENGGLFITNEIPNIICTLFADDVANSADNTIELQSQLNSISEFCNNTEMSITENKLKLYLEKVDRLDRMKTASVMTIPQIRV